MVIKFICQLFYPSLSPVRVYEDRGVFFLILFSGVFISSSTTPPLPRHSAIGVVECGMCRVASFTGMTHNMKYAHRCHRRRHTQHSGNNKDTKAHPHIPLLVVVAFTLLDDVDVEVFQAIHLMCTSLKWKIVNSHPRWSRERVKEKWEEWEKLG